MNPGFATSIFLIISLVSIALDILVAISIGFLLRIFESFNEILVA